MYILSNSKEKGIQLIMGFPFIKGGVHNINFIYLRSFKINVVVDINYHIFFGRGVGGGRVITTVDSLLFKVQYSNLTFSFVSYRTYNLFRKMSLSH